MRDASRADAQVYPWQGPLVSKDDEKHVFIAGTRGLQLAPGSHKRILITAGAASGVRVRCLAINTDFAGVSAYKFTTSVDIEGEAFWEYSSRLKEKLRGIEKNILMNVPGQVPQQSSFWLGDKLRKAFDISDFAGWSGVVVDQELATEIENMEVVTNVRGGPVQLQVPSQLKKP